MHCIQQIFYYFLYHLKIFLYLLYDCILQYLLNHYYIFIHKLIFGKAFPFFNKLCIKKSIFLFLFGIFLCIFAWHLKLFKQIIHLNYASFKLYFNLHFI